MPLDHFRLFSGFSFIRYGRILPTHHFSIVFQKNEQEVSFYLTQHANPLTKNFFKVVQDFRQYEVTSHRKIAGS